MYCIDYYRQKNRVNVQIQNKYKRTAQIIKKFCDVLYYLDMQNCLRERFVHQ